jgi:Putative DNA-binding domain
MLDERPLSDQTYADVEAFLRQDIGENLTLDYKRELSPDKDRSELCKDISALANSRGGTIIYGVDEEKPDRNPTMPPVGTPRQAGRQPIEEWAAQVLRTGVQPPLSFEIEPFELADDAERCVLLVRTAASPLAPHMVTLRGDNRYYGRFYRRSNYESRIAEEYEVREMLERARRLYEGVEGELARRGYNDPYSASFGVNPYTRRLAVRSSGEGATRRRIPAEAWTSFVLLSTAPAEASRQDRRAWLDWLDPNELRYEPESNGFFVPPVKRSVLGGVACFGPGYLEGGADLDEYLLTGFDGSVEFGFSSRVAMTKNDSERYFFGNTIIIRLWQTRGFAAEVRGRLGILAPHLLAVNIKGTEGAVLAGFAKDQRNRDPQASAWIDFEDAPKCLETNVQIRRELTVEDFEQVAKATAGSVPGLVEDLADDLCSAFGLADQVLVGAGSR